ncbi:hypothetical protein HA402_009798 [Bradysia odoriphaga]|nr:hypothetical protein HA402_009798 [Bradysia odoriphaga]
MHSMPTTGRYSSPSRRRNVVTAITDRAIRFTNVKDRPESISRVKEILKGNGYPTNFVSDIIKQRVDRFYNGKNRNDNKTRRFIPTTYVAGLSERLRKTLGKYDLTISCKSTNKIGDIYSRMKYTIPKANKSKLIYNVKCNECDVTYVGMTKQKLKDRMAKHKSDVHLRKQKETTGLTIHAITENHTFDYDKVTILDQIPNFFQRRIAEKMYIHKTEPNCNTQIDKDGLHRSYINLLLTTENPTTKKINQPRITSKETFVRNQKRGRKTTNG